MTQSVLRRAALLDLFDVIDTEWLGFNGKPARAAVFEDAIAGVAAQRQAGADLVVDDLAGC